MEELSPRGSYCVWIQAEVDEIRGEVVLSCPSSPEEDQVERSSTELASQEEVSAWEINNMSLRQVLKMYMHVCVPVSLYLCVWCVCVCVCVFVCVPVSLSVNAQNI